MKKVLIILCLASNLGYSQQLYRQTFSSGLIESSYGISMPGEAFNNTHTVGGIIVTESILNMPFHDSSLATSEVSLSNIIIYPNPVSERLYVKGDLSKKIEFKIYDNSGRMVLKEPMYTNGIDMSTLPIGLYYVLIFENQKLIERQKIIKE